MKFYIIYLFILTSCLSSWAGNVGQIVKQTDQIHSILSFEVPNGEKFQLNTDEADLLSNYGSLTENLGMMTNSEEPCDEEKKKKSNSITLILEYNKVKSGDTNTTKPENFELSSAFAESSGMTVAEINKVRSCGRKYNNLSDVQADFLSASANSKQSASLIAEGLSGHLQKKCGVLVPAATIANELIMNELISSPDNWRGILAANKGNIKFNDALNLVARFGAKNMELYNDRPSDNTILPVSQLLHGIKGSDEDMMGVCRDSALAQTQMLKELGIDSYLVAFKTIDGGHMTVAAIDPDGGGVNKINWGYVSSSNNQTGSSALDPDHWQPGVGLGYRIYSNDGKPLGYVPNGLGQMLKEASGGRKDNSFQQKSYNIGTVNVRRKNGNNFNVFTGETSEGDRVIGLSIHKDAKEEIGEKTQLDLSVGASLSKVESDKSLFKLDSRVLYSRLGAKVTQTIYDSGAVKVQTFLGAEAEYFSVNATQENKVSGGKRKKQFVNSVIQGQAGLKLEAQVNEATKINAGATQTVRSQVKEHSSHASNDTSELEIIGPEQLEYALSVAHQASEKVVNLSFEGLQDGFGETHSLGVSQENIGGGSTRYIKYTVPSGDRPQFADGAQEGVQLGYTNSLKKTNNKFFKDLNYAVEGFCDSKKRECNLNFAIKKEFK